MDAIKSKLSLATLKAISPIINPELNKISISTNNDILFLLKDNNKNFDFFFRAEKEEVDNQNQILFTFTCKPFSEIQKNEKSSAKLPLKGFTSKLDEWVKNIELYKTEEFLIDPIEKKYQEEFYNDFKIVDQDAETSSFNFSQQILLLEYVENVKTYIQEDDKEFALEDKQELLEHVVSLEKDIGKETKDSYIKKQSKFWAKVRKKSIKAGLFVVTEFAKQVIKIAAERGLTIEWQQLPYYVEHFKNFLNH